MVIKGAIFDFDGVVVDSHPAHLLAWKRFLQSVGKTVSEEQLHFALDGRKREEILRHFLGELPAERIAEYGLRKEQYFREEAGRVRTLDGLLGFLENLQSERLPLAIASSGSTNRIHFLLDRFGLRKYFQEIVTGDDVEHGKPHPALFLTAAQRLGVDSSQSIAFEDAVSGVQAAKSAGMKCVGIGGPDRVPILLAAGADHVAADFRSLSFSKLQELLLKSEEANSLPVPH